MKPLVQGLKLIVDRGSRSELPLWAVFAAIVPLVILAEILLNPNNYFGNGTVAKYFYQRMAYDQKLLLENHLPSWWNPLLFNGIPWAAAQNSSFYPVYLLLLRFFSLETALRTFILLHRACAGGFMALFLSGAGVRRFPAVLGGVIYALGGQSILYLENGHLASLASHAYLPLVCWLWWKSLTRAGAGWCLLTGLVFALQFSCGALSFSYLTLWGLFVMTALWLVSGGRERVQPLSFRQLWCRETTPPAAASRTDLLNTCQRLLVLSMFTAGLCLSGLSATLNVLNDPDLPGVSPEGAWLPNVPFPALLTLLIGNLFDPSSLDQRWVAWSAADGRLALTVVGFTMLLAAVLHSPKQRKTVPCGLFLLSLLPGLFPYFQVPAADAIGVGARFLVLTFFSACWLVALGADLLFELQHVSMARLVLPWIVLTGGACVVMNYTDPAQGWWQKLAYLLIGAPLGTLNDDQMGRLLVGCYIRTGWAFLLLVGTYAALTAHRLAVRQMSLFLLVCLELSTLAYPSLTFATPDNFQLPEPVSKWLKDSPPTARSILSSDWSNFAMRSMRAELSGQFVPNVPFALAAGRAHGSLGNRDAVPFSGPVPFYANMAARYYVLPVSADKAPEQVRAIFRKYRTLVYNSEDSSYVYEDPEAKPRAFLAATPQLEPDQTAACERFGLATDQLCLVEQRLPIDASPLQTDEVIQGLTIEPDRVVLTVQVSASRLLVLTDSYAAGWRVSIDGLPQKVVRVNGGVCRGVVVPSGTHQVLFEYDPAASGFTGPIQGAFLLLAAGVVLSGSFEMRKSKTRRDQQQDAIESGAGITGPQVVPRSEAAALKGEPKQTDAQVGQQESQRHQPDNQQGSSLEGP